MANYTFQYKPLDHTKQSIRLVHLSPELSDFEQWIQINITHTEIGARYVCLSYQWGSANILEGNWILVNGSPFLVQQNLFDFLSLMRMTAVPEDAIFHPTMGYWIDALCINQHDASEKHHQVVQMGSIYQQAEFVHVWLGAIDNAGLIRRLIDGPREPKDTPKWSEQVTLDMDFVHRHFFLNEYWTRSWVIQEFMLAHRIEVSLNRQRFAFSDLVRNIHFFSPHWIHTPFKEFALHHLGKFYFIGQPLIRLLTLFQKRKCSLVQDRIFSLTSLCDERDSVQVDYRMHANKLAYNVLK
ncbi:hypothetical protein CC86DRAFT_357646, partial [Ophiobolus disseminans]